MLTSIDASFVNFDIVSTENKFCNLFLLFYSGVIYKGFPHVRGGRGLTTMQTNADRGRG